MKKNPTSNKEPFLLANNFEILIQNTSAPYKKAYSNQRVTPLPKTNHRK